MLRLKKSMIIPNGCWIFLCRAAVMYLIRSITFSLMSLQRIWKLCTGLCGTFNEEKKTEKRSSQPEKIRRKLRLLLRESLLALPTLLINVSSNSVNSIISISIDCLLNYLSIRCYSISTSPIFFGVK